MVWAHLAFSYHTYASGAGCRLALIWDSRNKNHICDLGMDLCQLLCYRVYVICYPGDAAGMIRALVVPVSFRKDYKLFILVIPKPSATEGNEYTNLRPHMQLTFTPWQE